MSLLLFGLTLLIQRGFDNQLKLWTGGVEMIVYVQNGADDDKVDIIRQELERQTTVVEGVEYCDEACSTQVANTLFAGDPDTLAQLLPKIPSFFKVKPVDKESSDVLRSLKDSFQALPNVVDVRTPDEAVAVGAAIQGQVLAGDRTDVLLLDVTPLSLGIETLGGVMTKMITKNTTIPTRFAQTFSTADDNQPAVTIKVFQGEREMATGNKLLGEFNLEGIAPAPRGTPQIEVAFDIDANGILHVSAKDKGTGKENKITIKANSGLSEEEIQKMVKDAELNAAEDKKKLEIVQSRNQADAAVHSVKKSLNEHGDQLEAGEKEKIEAALKEVEEALKGEDKDTIDSKTEALMSASQKLGEKVYANMQAQQAAAGAAGAAPGAESTKPADDNVVDAEVKEVKKG